VNLLAFSPQEYLLRSVGVSFRPCAAILLGSGASLIAFLLLRQAPDRRFVVFETAVLGSALVLTGSAVLFHGIDVAPPLAAAIFLIAGALLIESAATLSRTTSATALRRGLVAGVVAIGLFWSFAVYAQQTGERVARSMVPAPGHPSTAIVFSKVDLGLSGPGVTMTRREGKAELPYRYDGLRLFIYREKRWYLLPVGWRRDNQATAIILPDSDQIRIELHP
jgi:hypothetical protein